MSGGGATGPPPPEAGGPALRRVIGPWLLLLFVVGDILGTGVYALTGKVAGKVGGAVWLPFASAFLVAIVTAMSYLELVTKYPRAAGAALYTHKAWGMDFLTFLVAFAVMSSGLTSAASASKAFAGNLSSAFAWTLEGSGLLLVGVGFIVVLALVNLRGVGESLRMNVLLTCVELSGLLIIIAIGGWALAHGEGHVDRLTQFDVPAGGSVFGAVTAGTALAFFAMVGFEDSVNMAEETKDPVRVFPRVMLAGLTVTGLVYVLVAVSAVSLVSPAELAQGAVPLLKVVSAGAPGFPLDVFAYITMFAVANSALINMLMASRLLYGMAREEVLPGVLGRVLPRRRTPYVAIGLTTVLASLLVGFADLAALGGTTALLLLCVFTLVNIAVLVLRRDQVEGQHFRAPTVFPVLGALMCAYLASPFSGRATADYVVAGWLMLVGVVLSAVTYLLNRWFFRRPARVDRERWHHVRSR